MYFTNDSTLTRPAPWDQSVINAQLMNWIFEEDRTREQALIDLEKILFSATISEEINK